MRLSQDYFRLVPREPFKSKSWQSKAWRCGTEGIIWAVPGDIPGRSKRKKANIKRVVVAYKAYIKRGNGSKRIVGKLKTRRSINYHCIADTPAELEDLLDDVVDLEQFAKREDERYSGKLKHIMKCMVIYDDGSTDCIIDLNRLYKYFGRVN